MEESRDTLEQKGPGVFASIRAGAATNSSGVWSRAAILFAALCLIKLVMLWSLQKHLFEIHWRVSVEKVTTLNAVAFYLFALLIGLNLWKLAARCMLGGARLVRSANACVLFLGTLFILLTFHEGDKGYLYAVINGVLGWKDLWWYLVTNSCFRSPYLVAWLLGYGFVYYLFFRTNREHLVLRVTAVFATAYVGLCLGDLSGYCKVIVVADCIGLACLFPIRPGDRLSWFRIGALIGWTAYLYLLFAPSERYLRISHMVPEFVVILLGSLVFFVALSVFAWLRGFFADWFRMLPFALIAFFLLINSNYPMAVNYRNLLAVGFMLPRYFLGEFCIALVLLITALGYRKWRPAGSLWWLDAANLILIAMGLADLRLSQVMGVRLDWDVVSLAFGETPKMMWRIAQPYFPLVVGALLIVGGLYAVLVWLARRIYRQSETSGPSPVFGSAQFIIIAFVLLALAGNWLVTRDKVEGQTIVRLVQTSPLLKHAGAPVMDYATFVKTARQLGMDNLETTKPIVFTEPPRDLNVVLVFQESTYNKHLSLFGSEENTQPLLFKYKDRMEIFPNFFSSFAGSINAQFATFTGLYPVRDYNSFTTIHVPVKSIFEILNEHNYQCSMFYSTFFDYTGFRDFLRGRGLDPMYDADTMPGQRKTAPVSWGLQEEETLDAIRHQIKSYAAEKRKFFLTYIPVAPHNPFDGTPARFRKYPLEEYGNLKPRYLNELLYLDWVISSIIDELKDSGLLDNTIVVITADHGEMLGEGGSPVGHGWMLTPELANVPLIIMDPDHPNFRINHTIGSQVDLIPTILDRLRIPIPSGQLYQGKSLYSPDLNPNRTIYLNSFRQYGIIQDSRFIRGDRESEAGDLSDSSQPVFAIASEDNHTSFVPMGFSAKAVSIAPFDRFQENFLHNYLDYCRMIHPDASEK
jgi:phosphoglycerol transferase MdoB-like AlkP superfamily enzyme